MVRKSSQPEIECKRSTHRVAYFDAGLPADLAERLWHEPQSLVALGEPLRANKARHTVLLSWQSQQFVLKHYNEHTWRHALKQCVSPSRAWSTWSTTHRLVAAGVATPRPVACVENRWGVLRRDSFLMYPYVEGQTLRKCLLAEKRQHPTNAEHLWRQLSDLWRRLGQLRVSLADTNAGNFIIGPNGQLWVIDLDKARFHRVALVAAMQRNRGWQQLLRSVKKV